MNVLTNVFIHPFSEMSLASISTCTIVNENVTESMLKAKINAMNEMEKFTDFNLGNSRYSSTPSREAALWRLTPSRKRETAKLTIKLYLLKTVKIFSQKYLLLLRDLFSFSLRAVPLVLAEIDGTLIKAPKFALLHKLEADILPAKNFPLNSAMIIDGIALVCQIRTSKMIFEEFAIKL